MPASISHPPKLPFFAYAAGVLPKSSLAKLHPVRVVTPVSNKTPSSRRVSRRLRYSGVTYLADKNNAIVPAMASPDQFFFANFDQANAWKTGETDLAPFITTGHYGRQELASWDKSLGTLECVASYQNHGFKAPMPTRDSFFHYNAELVDSLMNTPLGRWWVLHSDGEEILTIPFQEWGGTTRSLRAAFQHLYQQGRVDTKR